MKKILVLFSLLFILPVLAQDHFSGITKRVGIINIGMNPSELANLAA
jgi:hypothetical protein